MNENWLTSTVSSLCNEMRATGDYSLLPILGDALLDADCTDADLIAKCHRRSISPIMTQCLLCEILGGELRNSLDWLRHFIDNADCPGFEDTMAAAIGINLLADQREDDIEINGRVYDMSGYNRIENDGEYLHFGGRDAHGSIPPEFWEHVAVVTGKTIPSSQRASGFSCSC